MNTKIINYGLYQTLNQNIPKRDLTVAQKTSILDGIESLAIEEKEALIMLIYEHARLNDNFVYDNNQLSVMPYNGEFSNKSINLDIKNFPIGLRWIIFKFINIIQNKKKPVAIENE